MLPGQLLGERYRLESEAGSGGMGTVWRALDTRIERTVAIKILHSHLASDDQLRMRFAREARAVGALQHPGIVQLYDFTETSIDGEPMAYLVMEYVEGHSLADLLSPRDNLPVAQTMELVAAAAMGLQAAHDQGIIHRDVKPGNILVGADAVKIVDFGISQSHGDIKLTSTGHFMGSLHYVSPEQLQGETLTPISDVYSLGVVAYEALTGTRPFAGDTPASILTGHLHHAPTPLPTDIPAPVAAVVMRALDKDPSKRYPSAAAFAAACREVGADTDATVISAIPVPDPAESATTPPTTMEPAATAGARPRRQFVVVAAIVLAVVLAAGAGAAMWINGGAGAQGNDADDASGVEQLHKLEQLGEPIEYPGSDADDPGSVPEPVTAGGVAYFTHGGDDPRIIAVDLSTGKQKWRKPVSEPIGIALRAGREALYTADTEAGIVNFIDRESGESANVVELGGRITVGSAGDLVVVFAEDSETVSAYRADGSRAWERSFDSAVVELDIEAEWRKFSTQPGRYSKQDPRHMIIYGEDGMVWRLDTGSGDTVDSFDTGDDNLATLAHQGYMFTATQADDGTYTVTMRDVGDDFAEVGQWDSLRKGYTPRKLVACGKTRICVKDNDYGATGGAVVIDFGDTDGDPLWQSPADSNVTEVYAAGSTTAVVDGGQDSEPSTQLYNSEFEPLGRSKPGTFRPIDGRTFLDYPRTAGTEPANPLGEHFFTGLDAADGSTRDLGMREVHPQCVTDGSHMACSTPEGITVWGYRDGK